MLIVSVLCVLCAEDGVLKHMVHLHNNGNDSLFFPLASAVVAEEEEKETSAFRSYRSLVRFQDLVKLTGFHQQRKLIFPF